MLHFCVIEAFGRALSPDGRQIMAPIIAMALAEWKRREEEEYVNDR
jgi:hypothetical protein